jgi:DNA-binding IclR family transcriptional regulator
MAFDEVEERYRAPALDKGLDILELLAETEEGLSQAEIAKALIRSPNEIYRMLDRLVRRGYIARTPTDRYELTLKLFALAHRHAPMRRLVSQAMPILRDFARQAGQSCHIAVYDRGEVIVVAQVDSPNYWGIAIRVGARVGLFDTGSGHILMAYAKSAERNLMAEEHEMMPQETRPADLEVRLGDIVARGYEQMESRQTPSVVNLSVPVLGPHGSIIAALTCPYVQRLDAEAPDQQAVVKLLLASGGIISANADGAEQPGSK